MNVEIDFKELVDEINDLVQSVLPDGKVLYTNRAWRETLGYTKEEVEHLNLSDIVHPDNYDDYAETFQKILSGEKLTRINTALITKSGEKIIVAGSSNCAFKDGKPISTRSIFKNITLHTKIEQDLRESENMFQAFMDNTPTATFMKDERGRYVYVNKQLERMFQVKFETLKGKTDYTYLPEEIAEIVRENDKQVLETWKNSELLETVPTPDGSAKYWVVMKFPFKRTDGQKFVGGVAIDITKLKQAEEKLKNSEQHFRRLIEGSQGLICTHDLDGIFLSVNPAAQELLGYEMSEIIGKNLRDFIIPAGRKQFDNYLRRIRQNSVDEGLMIITAKNGVERTWKYNNVKLSETVKEPFILGHAQDVTEMHETQKELTNLSLTDDLTGLYNRRGFLMLAGRQLNIFYSRPNDKNAYLIFADMDGLKQINDTYGHFQGSLAITKMSEILSSNFRASDIVARLGGDEFVIFVVDRNNAGKEIILNRLQSKIDEYNQQNNHSFKLSLSVGVTPIDSDSKLNIEELIVRADQAMYVQKRRKKNQS